MEITANDLKMTMALTIAVIFMSFTFPALGLGGDAVQENEMPSFNISKGTVEFARESPDFPARPSGGELRYVNGSEPWEDERQVYLQRGDPEYVLSFFDDDADPGPGNVTYHANLIKFNATGSFTNDVNINESESKELSSVDGAYTVGLNGLEVVANNSTSQIATLDWEVLEQPVDQSFLGRIPVVGAVISGADVLASVVGWAAAIWWHFVVLIWNVIANGLLMFLNVILYFINSAWWLITTYTGLVAGAPTAWASTIVAIPGILLGFQFAKIIAVGISLLPFT